MKKIRISRALCITALACCFLGCSLAPSRTPVKVSLAQDGRALQPVIVSAGASANTRELAKELAKYLGLITGGDFLVEEGDGVNGIAVGNYDDFPKLKLEGLFDAQNNMRQDEYLLRTHGKGVYLVGATELGAQHAVWDFLYRIGFRQFFPGKVWEICPDEPNVSVSLDEFQSPDFTYRAIHGSGMELFVLPKTKEAFYQWRDRNRLTSGYRVVASHVYHDIIRVNRAYFDSHPEYLLGTGGEAKLDVSQPEVLRIAADYALAKFEADSNLNVVSMEPSDGGGWKESLGSPSDQVVMLANHVARAIQSRFPGKKIGILGYNFHSAPPTIKVDSNVIVMVSEYAIREGLQFEPILKGWKQMGADVGVTDPVFNIFTYLHDLPGQGKASDLNLLATSFPRHKELGARYWTGSSSPAWAPYGLGYYLISRFLWDVGDAQQMEELLADFYHRSFGAAAPEMREYYERYLLASGKPLLSENLIGLMYRKLKEALSVADSPGAIARIKSYITHVRYLELYFAYKVSEGADRQENFEHLARYAYSLRDCESDMISGFPAVNRLAVYDKRISRWDEKVYGKDVRLLEDKDMLQYLEQGIVNNELIDFTPLSFSTDLVPWKDKASGDITQAAPFTIKVGGNNLLYLYPNAGQGGFTFEVAGGLNYSNYGPVKLKLYAREHAVIEPIAEKEVPADKKSHTVHFDTPYKGLHWLEFGDGSVGGSSITWTGEQRIALPASVDSRIKFSMAQPGDLFFYVPKGTHIVGGFSDSPSGELVSADGKMVLDFKSMKKPGYFSVAAPKGQDGAWWRFTQVRGNKLLLTVPPYLTTSPGQGLVPREVKKTDNP